MYARIALIGGKAFVDGFESAHAGLMSMVAGMRKTPGGKITVNFLPTCAAQGGPERVHDLCEGARIRLSRLGAKVNTPRILDRESADDPSNARQIAEAD